MKRTVKFIDKDNKLARITVEDTNGYFSMSGEYDGGLGQVVDRINPATDAQKELVNFWKTYHLKEDFPSEEINTILDKIDEEFANRGEESEFDINEDNQDMFDVIAEVFGCDDTRAKAIVAVARNTGMTYEDIMKGVELDDDIVNFYGTEYLSLTDSEADNKAREEVIGTIEDCGGVKQCLSEEGFNYVVENCLNENEVYAVIREDVDNRVYEYAEESSGMYENYLTEWAVDNGVIDEEDIEDGAYVGGDDLEQLCKDKMTEDAENNATDYLSELYGDEIPDEYFDLDAVADYVVETDGRGNGLNRYDGVEYEEDVDGETFYIYRQ